MRDLLEFGYRDRPQRPRPLLRTIVGDVLRRTRLEQRRTLADVARSARISMQYLSEIERGRKEASSEILAALCTALRLDLSELLAAAGRDLLDPRGRRASLVRLAAYRDGDPRSGAPAQDPSAPTQPAADPRPANPTAVNPTPVPTPVNPRPANPTAVNLTAGDRTAGDLTAAGAPGHSQLSAPVRGSGPAICRLAA